MEPYDFQLKCVQKLRWYENILIGDDMGLGKTVEAILIDRVRREKSQWPARTLVLTYGSVVDSWVNHFREWHPELRVIKIDPKDRGTFSYAATQGTHDVYIMHWEALRLMPELKKIRWLHIIADEVHKIKNRKAQVTVALKSLPTKFKTAMSGTAADNAPQDLWSILNWLWPNEWRSFNAYCAQHVKIKMHNAGGEYWTECQACLLDDKVTVHQRAFQEVCGVANVEELMQKIGPYYIRRLKEDVLKELPDKYYTHIKVKLTGPQRRAYDQMAKEMLAWVGEHENQPVAAPVVIAQLTRLQQFGVAFGKLVEARRRRSADFIVLAKRRLADRGKPWLKDYEYEKYMALELTEPSTKLDAVMELLEANPNEPMVVFAQSKQVINLLGQRLAKEGITYGLLTGDTPQAARGPLVEEFQSGKLRVFAGTTSAGGVGITLTRARTVVFIDRSWSPAVNRQAEDRLHRIGQKNAVQVIVLEAEETIDEMRNRKIELKWEWLKTLLGDPKTTKSGSQTTSQKPGTST